MAAGHNGQDPAQAAGERIETLLAELRAQAGPELAGTARRTRELPGRAVGAGLTQIAGIIGADAEAGPRLMQQMVADPLVESLLLLHDLHPYDIGARVLRAVDEVMPQFGASAGTVEFLGVDETGVIRLRLERGGGHGCGTAPAETVQAAISRRPRPRHPRRPGCRPRWLRLPWNFRCCRS